MCTGVRGAGAFLRPLGVRRTGREPARWRGPSRNPGRRPGPTRPRCACTASVEEGDLARVQRVLGPGDLEPTREPQALEDLRAVPELVHRSADVGPDRLLPEPRPVLGELGVEQTFDGRPYPVDDRAETRAVGLPRPGDRLQRRVDRAAAAVAENDHQLDPEALDRELHAADP